MPTASAPPSRSFARALRRASDLTPDPSITTLLVRMTAWYDEVSAAAGRALLDPGTKAALQGLVQHSLDMLRQLAASPDLSR
jgi:hypothetical protein